MGRIIKEASEADPMGPGKLVVFANAVEDNPFMAGAFHGVGEADVVTMLGFQVLVLCNVQLRKFQAKVSMF